MSDLINILKSITNSIRQTGAILNIVYVEQISNYYYFDITIDDLQDLAANEWINVTSSGAFNSENVEITAIDTNTNTITIRRKDNAAITLFGTWQANAPYFLYSKLLNTSNELSLKDQSITYKNQKFPLIHVVLNILEKRDFDHMLKTQAQNIVIFFVKNSIHDANSDWRRDNIIEPILIPIYESFMQALRDSRYIQKSKNRLIEHDYIEDYEFGSKSTENNRYDKNKNIYNEITDGIIIRIDELNIFNIKECSY